MLDILKSGSEAGLKLSTYQYIGFGGFKFYDFEMLFRHVGIRDMISVEQDNALISRCKFNKPFNFITIVESSLATFLATATFRKPVVAWLDYDWGLSAEVVADVLTLGGKVPVGSFVFVTIRADLPAGLARLKPDQRVADLREELQDLALIRDNSDVENANFPRYAERVLSAVVTAALSKRSDGKFLLLFRTLYSDTAQMLTVGACLCPTDLAKQIARQMRTNFPFLVHTSAGPYRIPSFNLTMRERHLLDRISTSKRHQKRARESLRDIGIRLSTIDDYKRIVRFVPKYFESYV
jgi:hypothetical protein